jgi:malate dehydrogenase (oxaloacetate-decarboxylating)(NADP+)
MDHSVIQYHREAPSILVLAHVLVGEPDSTSPGHALADWTARFITCRAWLDAAQQEPNPRACRLPPSIVIAVMLVHGGMIQYTTAIRYKKDSAKMSHRERTNSTSADFPRGVALLRHPLFNKGTAFSARERDVLGLRGLLPAHVLTLQEQAERVLINLRRLSDDLEKYVALNSLRDRNETLFLRVVCDNIDEIQPLIYTPTVGLACQRFGDIFQRPRGIYLDPNDRGHIAQVLRNAPHPARLIVVTDGERILGLGDLGANGMGIPVGKLSLYAACAGIHPEHCLPVMLDVGTNNSELLEDRYYIGLRQRRLRGPDYDAFLDEFMAAAQDTFPGVLIQFEDFANQNAFRLLHKYRDRSCVFNDDIQGTAAVALAGIFSALRVTGSSLTEQKLLFLGAGEAATGIADLVVSAMVAQGCPEPDARQRNWLMDSRGLVVKARSDLAEHKLPYAHEHAPIGDFLAAIQALKPTAIIGVSAVGGTFTPPVLQAMAEFNARPIVFALSNPTSKAECSAEEAYRYTGGKALFACGSPFNPVKLDGRTFVPRQGNNSYIFPGVGLGAIASGTSRITDEMFMSAARTLANLVNQSDLDQGSLYPALPRIREVSAHIAAEVAKVAYQRGLATGPTPNDMLAHVQSHMYEPEYCSYVAV